MELTDLFRRLAIFTMVATAIAAWASRAGAQTAEAAKVAEKMIESDSTLGFSLVLICAFMVFLYFQGKHQTEAQQRTEERNQSERANTLKTVARLSEALDNQTTVVGKLETTISRIDWEHNERLKK